MTSQPGLPKSPGKPAADGAELARFLIGEFHGFFGYLKQAVEQYGSRGQVPQPKFDTEGPPPGKKNGKSNKDGKPRVPRTPTAFNLFVKQKIEAMKAEGFKAASSDRHDGLLSKAAAAWSALSKEERDAFAEGLKHDTPIPAAGVLPPESDAAPAAETEKKKKKRKKEAREAAANGVDAGNGVDAPEGETLKKKKKKKKKHREEAE